MDSDTYYPSRGQIFIAIKINYAHANIFCTGISLSTVCLTNFRWKLFGNPKKTSIPKQNYKSANEFDKLKF